MGTRSLGQVAIHMNHSIFLSASVPDPRRSPRFAATADPVAISSAVTALVHVVLGRRPLVWGGHPAITPMVWTVAEDIDADYSSWVRLYQSRFFEEDFPEENQHFKNVVYTETVNDDRGRSLLAMREKMFTGHDFHAAVFIGGMDGILDEFELFHRHCPEARIVPVASAGGAALELAEEIAPQNDALWSELDYIALFHRSLDISVRELRYTRPENQPKEVEQRYWHGNRKDT